MRFWSKDAADVCPREKCQSVICNTVCIKSFLSRVTAAKNARGTYCTVEGDPQIILQHLFPTTHHEGNFYEISFVYILYIYRSTYFSSKRRTVWVEAVIVFIETSLTIHLPSFHFFGTRASSHTITHFFKKKCGAGSFLSPLPLSLPASQGDVGKADQSFVDDKLSATCK